MKYVFSFNKYINDDFFPKHEHLWKDKDGMEVEPIPDSDYPIPIGKILETGDTVCMCWCEEVND